MTSPHAVLDSSVLLCAFFHEAGADVAVEVGRGAAVSSVNAAEVASRMADKGAARVAVSAALQSLSVVIFPFESVDALVVCDLRAATRSLGISLGDHACLALAQRLGLPVYTADRKWKKLDIGVDIRLIR